MLRGLRVRETIYNEAVICCPWSFDFPAKMLARFHVVIFGNCVLEVGGTKVPLDAGDAVVLPFGKAHTLRSNNSKRSACKIEPVNHTEVENQRLCSDGLPSTRLICGLFKFDAGAEEFLFEGDTDFLVGRSKNISWAGYGQILSTLKMSHEDPTSAAIADRLVEALLIAALREQPESSLVHPGTDPGIANALKRLHADPAYPWTVRELSSIAGMSRANFAKKFRECMQITPHDYLNTWRMTRARELLIEGQGVSEVANKIGFSNGFAFSKSFKKKYGTSPTDWLKNSQLKTPLSK